MGFVIILLLSTYNLVFFPKQSMGIVSPREEDNDGCLAVAGQGLGKISYDLDVLGDHLTPIAAFVGAN